MGLAREGPGQSSAVPLAPARTAFCSDDERHLVAVARSLGWAREAAARGEYADAIGWLDVIEAIGDKLSQEYELRRRAWRRALARGRYPPSGRDTH